MITNKITNIQSVEQYPDNYDNLDIETKNKILSYMNGMDDLAQGYYNKYTEDVIENASYLKLYQHTLTGLTGAKNAYATLGIMVEYNFPREKNKWILATKEDAQAYIDYQGEPEIQEELNELISYGDIQ